MRMKQRGILTVNARRLNKKGIKVMLTNDVCKHGVTCMKKANHLGDRFVDIL